MVKYIISSILIIIALIIIALIFRKRVYDKVDYLEGWKLDIMNRNIAFQLAKIKELNLTGETQQKFEAWKSRWEHIVAKDLSDIEELLFDAEDAADRYRFPTANKTLRFIEQSLNQIELDIEAILTELDELLRAEEESREEIHSLGEEIALLRSFISQRRYQFGRADTYFEDELVDLDQKIVAYDEFVEQGEYTKAKQHVDEIRTQLEALTTEVEQFPDLYKKCKDELPMKLDELLAGIKEMEAQGYRIKHLGLKTEVQQYKQRLVDGVQSLEKGNSSEVSQLIPEIEERIEEIYDELEKEAIAKNYIETQVPGVMQTMKELASTFVDTQSEVEQLKTAYYFEDNYMEKYLSLEKSVTQLTNELDDLSDQLTNEDKSHIALRNELEDHSKQLENLQEEHNKFRERLQSLRKDETEAEEQLFEMREQISAVNRKLQKSNIPGVPRFIQDLIETAENQMEQTMKTLEKQPLDIAEVQHALNETKIAVDTAVEKTNTILDQSHLTEKVIQYANRYRSQYPLLAAKLMESERLFRSCEYELALEHAAEAIEEIEPGALKKIEASLE